MIGFIFLLFMQVVMGQLITIGIGGMIGFIWLIIKLADKYL